MVFKNRKDVLHVMRCELHNALQALAEKIMEKKYPHQKVLTTEEEDNLIKMGLGEPTDVIALGIDKEIHFDCFTELDGRQQSVGFCVLVVNKQDGQKMVDLLREWRKQQQSK